MFEEPPQGQEFAPDHGRRLGPIFLDYLGGALILTGVDVAVREEQFALAIILAIIGFVVLWAGLQWDRVLGWLPRLAGVSPSLDRVAGDFRYWLAVLFALLFLARGPQLLVGVPYALDSADNWLASFHNTDLAERPAPLPTLLRIQVSDSGDIQEISRANVREWSAIPVAVSEVANCPSITLFSTPVPPECLTKTLNPFTTPLGTTTLSQPAPAQYTAKRDLVLLLVSFSRPTRFKSIAVNSHGASLPKWTVEQRSPNHVIIEFDGKPSDAVIDISTVN